MRAVCSMVLQMMLPHHCPHPEPGPTDEHARMCPVRACAAVGRLCVRKCAADAGEPSGSGRTHPIRSIERQRATSARPSARPRRLTASRDGPHAGPSGIFYRYSRHRDSQQFHAISRTFRALTSPLVHKIRNIPSSCLPVFPHLPCLPARLP